MVAYSMQFHECDGTVTEMLHDMEFDGFAEAHRYAVDQARKIMAREIRQGRLCLSCWIVIRDASGHVSTLQFGEAVTVAESAACLHQTEAEARRFAPAGPTPVSLQDDGAEQGAPSAAEGVLAARRQSA